MLNGAAFEIEGYQLNPELVRLFRANRVEIPEVTDIRVMRAFSAIKPNDIVDEETYWLVRNGLNPKSSHPGMIFVRNGTPLPVLVPIFKNSNPAPRTRPEVQSASVLTIREFAVAIKANLRFNFGGWQNGEKECSVYANSPEGVACVCGRYGDPIEMRGLQIGHKKVLAIGVRCAAALADEGVNTSRAFSSLVNVRTSSASPQANASDEPRRSTAPRKTRLDLDSLEAFARHVRMEGFLRFSVQTERGGPVPCTLEVNGHGICSCGGNGNPWNMYALLVGTKHFAVSPVCRVRLLGADPDLCVTAHSFAQQSGWGTDRNPVESDRASHDPHAAGYVDCKRRKRKRNAPKGGGKPRPANDTRRPRDRKLGKGANNGKKK